MDTADGVLRHCIEIMKKKDNPSQVFIHHPSGRTHDQSWLFVVALFVCTEGGIYKSATKTQHGLQCVAASRPEIEGMHKRETKKTRVLSSVLLFFCRPSQHTAKEIPHFHYTTQQQVRILGGPSDRFMRETKRRDYDRPVQQCQEARG